MIIPWRRKPNFNIGYRKSHYTWSLLEFGYLFNEGGGTEFSNIASTGSVHDLGIGTGPTHGIGAMGRGVNFDNSGGNAGSEIVINSPDPGFWHDSFTERTWFIHCTMELDGQSGPYFLAAEGGNGNGMGVFYRTGPNTITFATAQNSTRVEIASATTFNIFQHSLRIAVKYDNGSMSLFINGKLEATGSNGTSIPAHSSQPGLGMGNAGNDNTIQDSSIDEWGGKVYEWYGYTKALPDSDCVAWTQNPYIFLEPLKKPSPYFVSTAENPFPGAFVRTIHTYGRV